MSEQIIEGENKGGDAGNTGGGSNAVETKVEYVPKQEYESLASEFQSFKGEFERLKSEASQRAEKDPARSTERKSEPKEPQESDYDFKGKGWPEVLRFQRDTQKYFSSLERKEAEQSESQEKSVENLQKINREHNKRVSEYKKGHPEYETDLAKARAIHLYDDIGPYLRENARSAEIFHHIAKNPNIADELNEARDSGGAKAVVEYIGGLSWMLKHNEAELKAKTETAGARPPRFSLGGGGNGQVKKSAAEIFREFHK